MNGGAGRSGPLSLLIFLRFTRPGRARPGRAGESFYLKNLNMESHSHIHNQPVAPLLPPGRMTNTVTGNFLLSTSLSTLSLVGLIIKFIN